MISHHRGRYAPVHLSRDHLGDAQVHQFVASDDPVGRERQSLVDDVVQDVHVEPQVIPERGVRRLDLSINKNFVAVPKSTISRG